MNKQYLYNEKTGTLHILGYCSYVKYGLVQLKSFDTEQEAYAYAGKNIKPCKSCEREKEARLILTSNKLSK